jgi:hypothetical protein
MTNHATPSPASGLEERLRQLVGDDPRHGRDSDFHLDVVYPNAIAGRTSQAGPPRSTTVDGAPDGRNGTPA